ncbi:MAG: helix-turn-helix domain-containing protein [Knoellia sp.]
MREWIPISTSPKGRLALTAIREFGARSFDEVTVSELAAASEVTTGAIYHHFGSKLGLYEFVRADVERRLLDRIEGALAAGPRTDSSVEQALLVGFDFAVREGLPRLLGAPPAAAEHDRLVEVIGDSVTSPILGQVLAAAWRAAVAAVADGAEREIARAALQALRLRVETSPTDPSTSSSLQ